jgi:hypothetical protein
MLALFKIISLDFSASCWLAIPPGRCRSQVEMPRGSSLDADYTILPLET